MQAGRLRHRVTIEAQQHAQDPTTGEITVTWQPHLSSVPAEIVPLSGREFLSAQAGQAEITARATIRWVSGIEPTMRVVHEGRNFNIRAVLPDPTFRKHITLMLAEGVNDGD